MESSMFQTEKFENNMILFATPENHAPPVLGIRQTDYNVAMLRNRLPKTSTLLLNDGAGLGRGRCPKNALFRRVGSCLAGRPLLLPGVSRRAWPISLDNKLGKIEVNSEPRPQNHHIALLLSTTPFFYWQQAAYHSGAPDLQIIPSGCFAT